MKTLIVGDLHLRDRELSTTNGMIKSSVDMLVGIKQALLDDPEITMVLFLGDIQHDTPNTKRTLRETTLWKTILGEIGSIVSERCPKFMVVPREIDEVEEGVFRTQPVNPLPLFSLSGNHDIEKVLRSVNTNYNYTFYDDLLYTGILQNPRGIIFKDSGRTYYFQFNNYGEVNFPIPDEIKELDSELRTIKLLHDTVRVPTSPDWFNVLPESDYYKGEDVLGDSHLAVCGHIHEPLAPVKVKGNGTLGDKETIFLQTGAMGRTSFTDDNMRDFGYCTLLDTTDGLKVSELKIPLMPIDDYFNWKQVRLNENKKEAMKAGKMFSLDFGTRIIQTNPKEEILGLADVSDKVKDNCVDALDRVDNE